MEIIKKSEKIELNPEEEKAFDIVCNVLSIIRGESENDELVKTAYHGHELILEVMEYFD